MMHATFDGLDAYTRVDREGIPCVVQSVQVRSIFNDGMSSADVVYVDGVRETITLDPPLLGKYRTEAQFLALAERLAEERWRIKRARGDNLPEERC